MEDLPRQDMPANFDSGKTSDMPLTNREALIESQETGKEQVPPSEPPESEEVDVQGARRMQNEASLAKVRAELGITAPASASVKNSPQEQNPENPKPGEEQEREKITRAIYEDMRNAFNRFAGEVQELETSLKSNKFAPLSLHAEDMKMFEEGVFDAKKAHTVLDTLNTDLRREFMPKAEHDRLSIEPLNYSRLLDALDEVRGVVVGLRSKVDKSNQTLNSPELIALSKDMTGIATTIRKKMDALEEMQTALRRYTAR